MAEALSTALGKPVAYVNVTPAQARASTLQAGFPGWVADFINALRDMESRDLASAVSPDVERITGRPATPYPATLRAVLS